ncbi:putative signal transduction protein [Thermodesulfatator indicus DSM 15286]|uniref:Signal transduction protein n=1 Tax=Thermodesulfatator indicus (strain DSM 15286 / JCM 11887 / CIR29812) TaxID=667014 RepID=F8AAL6_THEID|nr:HDOD domain-containing protein [Thermodesulfatator indicus]AEH44288.1 putative signal transduction protein [Thermodesulfatator indicus DSM 15286]
MEKDRLAELTKRLEKLPTLPQTSQKVLSAIEKDASAKELEKIIYEDQALAAKILKIANSPLYAAASGETKSLKMAIVRLGFGEVRNIVLASALSYILKPSATFKKFDMLRLWTHAIGTARAAFLLGEQENSDAEMLYSLGLLHDIGRLVEAVFLPDYFLKILAIQEAKSCSFYEAEKEVGIFHNEIGSYVAQKWRFSEDFVRAIKNHHQPVQNGKVDKISAFIFKADIVARAAGFVPEEDYNKLPKWPKALPLNKKELTKVILALKKEREDLLQAWHPIISS